MQQQRVGVDADRNSLLPSAGRTTRRRLSTERELSTSSAVGLLLVDDVIVDDVVLRRFRIDDRSLACDVIKENFL